jgi:hypothetical protein
MKEKIWDRKRQKVLGTKGREYRDDDVPDGLVDALETDMVDDQHGTVPVFCLLIGEGGGRNLTPYGLILVNFFSELQRSCYTGMGNFEHIS